MKKIPPLNLQLIYTDGKPTRAIIDVEALEALLECAEDVDDLEYLASLTAEDLQTITLEDYLESARQDKSADSKVVADGERSKSKDVSGRHRKAG